MLNQIEQCMIKKEINDIIFKYQFSKFNKSGGQQTFGMSIGINPLNVLKEHATVSHPFSNKPGKI